MIWTSQFPVNMKIITRSPFHIFVLIGTATLIVGHLAGLSCSNVLLSILPTTTEVVYQLLLVVIMVNDIGTLLKQ